MRRLSVGLEILADVDVLILDEVTSGTSLFLSVPSIDFDFNPL